MASELFNSISGYSAGIPPVAVVDANGNIVTNVLTTGNVAADKVYAANYYYANGHPFTGGNSTPGGNNTQLQFNNLGTFGGIPDVTYDGSTLSLGDISNITIGGGTANYFLQTDGNGSLTWTPISIYIAGSNRQVQYNNNGVFGGNNSFIFDSTTSTLTVAGNIAATNIKTDHYLYANGHSVNFNAAAGSSTEIQFNVNGDLAGSSNLTFNSITNTLTVNGNITTTNIRADNYRYANGSLIDFAATGGANTDVQFNDDGILNGTSNFTFNKANNALTVTGSVLSGNANLGNSVIGNYFIGSGAFLSNLPAANLVGSVPLAAQVSSAAQPNITSVGSLTSLIVIGNISSFGTIAGSSLTATSNVTAPNITAASTLTSTGTVNFSGSPNVTLGSISNLHISGGSNNYVLTTDGNGTISWGPGGSGTPSGSNTQVQFNDSGAFGGSAFLTYNKSSTTLTVAGDLVANSITIGAGAYKFAKSNVFFATTTTTSVTELLSIDATNLSGVDFTVVATDISTGNRQISKLASIIYQTKCNYNEYSTLYVNGLVGDLSLGYNPGNILVPASLTLYTQSESVNLSTYKINVTAYQE